MRKMKLAIRSLFFDEGGSGERIESSTEAELTASFAGVTLRYADEENGMGKTELFIKSGTPCVVKMKNSATEMSFSVGETHRSLYRVEELGEFDLAVTATRVESDITEEKGGTLRLDYESVLGGARRRTVMTLVAAPTGEDAK